jgi:hypothetical protein
LLKLSWPSTASKDRNALNGGRAFAMRHVSCTKQCCKNISLLADVCLRQSQPTSKRKKARSCSGAAMALRSNTKLSARAQIAPTVFQAGNGGRPIGVGASRSGSMHLGRQPRT